MLRVQELDEAARRRMPKQLYIPLPCEAARQQMVQRALGPECEYGACKVHSRLAASQPSSHNHAVMTDGTAGFGAQMRVRGLRDAHTHSRQHKQPFTFDLAGCFYFSRIFLRFCLILPFINSTCALGELAPILSSVEMP